MNTERPLIEALLANAQAIGLIKARNLVYLRNRLYATLGHQPEAALTPCQANSRPLASIAAELLASLPHERQALLGANQEGQISAIIDCLLPLPDSLEQDFHQHCQRDGIKPALDWLFQLGSSCDYIKTADLAKNISWSSATDYGTLEITINLARPEKDPADIARAKQLEQSQPKRPYPTCQLCIENEGFNGSLQHPARANLRLIGLSVNQEPWSFQFSPYQYYHQHAILLSNQHRDMCINQQTFENFFTLLDQIPHYIVGSNSDIPIVGGSILTHEHYQAGEHSFPIERARVLQTVRHADFPEVKINYLYWPLSTLQLIGSRQALQAIIRRILPAWYRYQNPRLGIMATSPDGERHNAITPIMRKLADDQYCVYLILRNNHRRADFPMGLYHPHPQHHHIKKENIGLIEAMGLAILPGRLAPELARLGELLVCNDTQQISAAFQSQAELQKHQPWFTTLQSGYRQQDSQDPVGFIQQAVAQKFAAVLENCGVFKQDASGQDAALHFINQI